MYDVFKRKLHESLLAPPKVLNWLCSSWQLAVYIKFKVEFIESSDTCDLESNHSKENTFRSNYLQFTVGRWCVRIQFFLFVTMAIALTPETRSTNVHFSNWKFKLITMGVDIGRRSGLIFFLLRFPSSRSVANRIGAKWVEYRWANGVAVLSMTTGATEARCQMALNFNFDQLNSYNLMLIRIHNCNSITLTPNVHFYLNGRHSFTSTVHAQFLIFIIIIFFQTRDASLWICINQRGRDVGKSVICPRCFRQQPQNQMRVKLRSPNTNFVEF